MGLIRIRERGVHKEMYTKLGMYEEIQPQLYRFLVAFSESAYPSGTIQTMLADMSRRWTLSSLDGKKKKAKARPKKPAGSK